MAQLINSGSCHANVLSYLHSAFSPPVAHGNLKAANVLLDENLMPRVSDCGLAILRPLRSNQVKFPVSSSKNQLHVEIKVTVKVLMAEVLYITLSYIALDAS